MRGTSRTVVIGVAAVTLLMAGVAAFTISSRSASSNASAPRPTQPGATLGDRPAPTERFALPLRTLDGFGDGDDVSLEQLIGQPLVVNFWATWCAPCVREMPALQRVAAEYDGRVTFLGVNVMDAPSNAEKFAADLGIGYTLAADPQGTYWKATRSFGMPTTLLVARDGAVVYRHTGELDAAQLRELIDTHLQPAR